MIRFSFFREEAALNHAQPDSLDGLARVDLPHHQLASKLVISMFVIALISLALFAMRGSLRIDAFPIQGAGATELILSAKPEEAPSKR